MVALGKNGEGFIPELPRMDNCKGEIVHFYSYKSGENTEVRRLGDLYALCPLKFLLVSTTKGSPESLNMPYVLKRTIIIFCSHH